MALKQKAAPEILSDTAYFIKGNNYFTKRCTYVSLPFDADTI